MLLESNVLAFYAQSWRTTVEASEAFSPFLLASFSFLSLELERSPIFPLWLIFGKGGGRAADALKAASKKRSMERTLLESHLQFVSPMISFSLSSC